MYIRDPDGTLLQEAEHDLKAEFAGGNYLVELDPPIKVYLLVEGPFTVTAEAESTVFEFEEATDIVIGARSRHTRPAATITATGDPAEFPRIIELMGSAMKTRSPEATFPTLRGHPPLVEIGERFAVPSGLSVPDEDITLELPTSIQSLYEVAPLAFYLGAEIVDAAEPMIRTTSGFEIDLQGEIPFRSKVAQILEHVFLLDSVVRTEGIYPITLAERMEVEDRLDLNIPDLYDRPLSERLEYYLQIPFDTLEAVGPKWKSATYVPPTASSIEVLPYALDEMSLIHAAEEPPVTSRNGKRPEFSSGFARAERRATPSRPTIESELGPDVLTKSWFRSGAPRGATKATIEAYRNRVDRSESRGDISIAVVQNDPRMESERVAVESIYGPRERLPFDVSYHTDLSIDGMGSLLLEDIDFLHYIGHVDAGGFECTDGVLDIASMEDIGVRSFFLNACRSYEQGLKLIEGGAHGGVVTLEEVINREAITFGRTLAKLLHRGFPLFAAVDLARGESIAGDQYLVIGDGEATIAQSESGVVFVGSFEEHAANYSMKLRTYPTLRKGMGTTVLPTVGDEYVHYLNGGTVGPIRIDRSEFRTFLDREESPVLIDGNLRWSSEVDVDDIS
jgi:hypothetical protein